MMFVTDPKVGGSRPLVVGDKMMLLTHDQVLAAVVAKVTKTGMFYVDVKPNARFTQSGHEHHSLSRQHQMRCLPFDEAAFATALADLDKRKAAAIRLQQRMKAEHEERERKRLEQIEELQQLMPPPEVGLQKMDDGSSILSVFVPSRPDVKWTWSYLTVVVRPARYSFCKIEPQYPYSYNYVRSGDAGACSGSDTAASVSDAIWESIRQCYHAW